MTTFDELKTLLDETRVKVHLASMDARDAFEEINREAQKLGHGLGRESHEVASKLVARLRSIADSIADGGD